MQETFRHGVKLARGRMHAHKQGQVELDLHPSSTECSVGERGWLRTEGEWKEGAWGGERTQSLGYTQCVTCYDSGAPNDDRSRCGRRRSRCECEQQQQPSPSVLSPLPNQKQGDWSWFLHAVKPPDLWCIPSWGQKPGFWRKLKTLLVGRERHSSRSCATRRATGHERGPISDPASATYQIVGTAREY